MAENPTTYLRPYSASAVGSRPKVPKTPMARVLLAIELGQQQRIVMRMARDVRAASSAPRPR